MKSNYFELHGHFHLDIIDKQTDTVLDTVDDHNMIMTPARKSMAEIFANLFNLKFAHKFALGTMGCQDGKRALPRDEYTGFEKSRDRLFCEPSQPYNVGEVVPVILYGDILTIRGGVALPPGSVTPPDHEPDKITGSWMSKTGATGSWSVDETGEGTWSSTDGAAGTVSFTTITRPDEPEPEPEPEEPEDPENQLLYYQYLGDRQTEYVIVDSDLANPDKFRVVKQLPYVYYTKFELPRYNVDGPTTEWNTDKTSMDAIGVQQKDTSVIFTFVIDQESGNEQYDNDPDFITPTSEFNEAAIYVNDRIFCMKTFPTKIKDNSVKFKITWTITF